MSRVLLIVVLAILLGVAVAVSPLLAVGAALALLLLPLAVRRPYLAGVGLLLWGGVRFAVLELIGVSGLYANAIELLVLAVVVAAAVQKGRRDHWVLKEKAAWVLAGLFAAESIVSWAVNRGSVIGLFSGLRGMFILPVLVVSTALLVEDVDRDRGVAWKVACWFVLFQIPVAFWQYFVGGGATTDPDLVTGTLGVGGANVLGVLMLALLVHSVAQYSKRRRSSLLLVALAAILVMLMCSARLPLLLSPVGAAFVFVTESGMGSIGRRVAIVVAGFLLVAPVLYYALPSYRADLGGGFEVETLVREQTVLEPGRVPRLAYLGYGWGFTQRYSAFAPLGVGPASAASGAAANLNTPMAIEFATGLRLAAAGAVSRLDAPVFIPYPTQVTASLVEYGIVGLVTYFAFVIATGVAIMRRCRRDDFPGADWRVFAIWFGFMTIGAVYANPWEGFSLLGIGFYSTILFLKPNYDEDV